MNNSVGKMSRRLPLVFLITLISLVNSVDICDHCVCSYNNKDENDFQGENVDCSYRKIKPNDFELPFSVYALDLSFTNLTTISAVTLFDSKTMTELFLNNNAIVNLTSNALQLPELRKLDLSYNFLEHIQQQTFRYVRKLEYLNLANNRFTTFEKLTFHPLSSLQEVILDNNDIGPSLKNNNLFDRSGYGLTNKIKAVSISGINLNAVPDNFFVDAYDIRKIVISNNNLTDIFELPFTIEYLDVSDNPIQEIEPEDFMDALILKELKLNNLAIKEVPPYTFEKINFLNIELERNKNLTVFSNLSFGRQVMLDPYDFTLQNLTLKGSRLTSLDESLSMLFGMLTRLDLQGNPWKCDCHILWIKKLQIPERDRDHLR